MNISIKVTKNFPYVHLDQNRAWTVFKCPQKCLQLFWMKRFNAARVINEDKQFYRSEVVLVRYVSMIASSHISVFNYAWSYKIVMINLINNCGEKENNKSERLFCCDLFL